MLLKKVITKKPALDVGCGVSDGRVSDDDELNINPPTPCQIGKRPPAPKPKENWPAFRESQEKRLELECEGGPPVASALVVVCDLAL
jgi:hypothetical protein